MLRVGRRLAGVGALVAVVVLGVSAPAAAGAEPPPGFRVVEHQALAGGVQHQRLQSDRPAQVVHVARVPAGAAAKVRAVLSNEAVAGPGARLERTSAMCRRARCVVAVNGDFALPGTDEPVGAMVRAGELVRSPNPAHHQLLIGPAGEVSTGSFTMKALLVPTDLKPLEPVGVNVTRGADQLVLYLPSYGPSTATNPHGSELVFEVLQPESGPVRLGHTALVRLVELRDGAGDTPIPPRRGVLSGHGAAAAALADLWARVQRQDVSPHALLRLEATPGVSDSIGGSPVLVRDGRRWVATSGDSFVTGRHPRTAVGRTASGDVLLVTVDGRQPGYSEGMTLAEVADLLLALGAQEAINLDGGGSTTFVRAGDVLNRPSDRLVRRRGSDVLVHLPTSSDAVVGNVERPVVSALVVVVEEPGSGHPPVDPLADPNVLPQAAPVGATTDPASNPELAMPALVPGSGGGEADPPVALTAFALALLLAVAEATRQCRARVSARRVK